MKTTKIILKKPSRTTNRFHKMQTTILTIQNNDPVSQLNSRTSEENSRGKHALQKIEHDDIQTKLISVDFSEIYKQ